MKKHLLMSGLFALAPSLVAAQPAPQITAAERAAITRYFAETLRDPESARWNVRSVDQTNVPGRRLICGTVNARNGFGGYTGPTGFWVVVERGEIRQGSIFDGSARGVSLC